jgi:hypothetical protein
MRMSVPPYCPLQTPAFQLLTPTQVYAAKNMLALAYDSTETAQWVKECQGFTINLY